MFTGHTCALLPPPIPRPPGASESQVSPEFSTPSQRSFSLHFNNLRLTHGHTGRTPTLLAVSKPRVGSTQVERPPPVLCGLSAACLPTHACHQGGLDRKPAAGSSRTPAAAQSPSWTGEQSRGLPGLAMQPEQRRRAGQVHRPESARLSCTSRNLAWISLFPLQPYISFFKRIPRYS